MKLKKWPLQGEVGLKLGRTVYLVGGCMIIRRGVAYHNDLRGTLTFDLKVK
jgi:hypothetical protein